MAMICLVGTKLNHALLPVAFAFSAGTFLYVSLTHIVPEIGSNLKAWHLLAMLAGLLFPYFCFIEAEFPFCFEQTRSRGGAQAINLSIYLFASAILESILGNMIEGEESIFETTDLERVSP